MNAYLAFCMIYAVSWWLVLFMVLPVGIKNADMQGGLGYAAAPRGVSLRRKLLATSLLTFIPAGLLHWFLQSGLAREWVL